MKKEKVGFAAFDKESGKGLNVVWGITNKLYLTDDPEKLYLARSSKEAKIYTVWFNDTHKNKKEFEIKEVVISIEVRSK